MLALGRHDHLAAARDLAFLFLLCFCACVCAHVCVCVCRSVNTGHNCTSLNLQCKALNTLGEFVVYDTKNSIIFMRFFLSEVNKSMEII